MTGARPKGTGRGTAERRGQGGRADKPRRKSLGEGLVRVAGTGSGEQGRPLDSLYVPSVARRRHSLDTGVDNSSFELGEEADALLPRSSKERRPHPDLLSVNLDSAALSCHSPLLDKAPTPSPHPHSHPDPSSDTAQPLLGGSDSDSEPSPEDMYI